MGLVQISRSKIAAWAVVSVMLFSANFVCGQQISGTITGAVKDSQQAGVPNAKVSLTSAERATTRDGATSADGSFVFAQLQPGTYTITVEAKGFKKFEQKDVQVFANDRVSLGDIVLSIGAVTETVSVEAEAAAVQTNSAERAGVLTGRQVVELSEISRSLFDLVATVPGVVYTGGLGGIAANGNRTSQNNFTLDGVTNVDTGSNGGTLATTNMDMIAEMKVITNSQPAEFGRSSGAQIEVVTKSGGKDFHGTGYLFHRNDSLNANTWRNNIDGRPRQLARYNYAGFNVGGPVYIPGKFNQNKDKLFFFVGIEWQNQLSPNNLSNVTVPTDLERKGDFSQTHDGSGFANNIFIKDPLLNQPCTATNKAGCFPGNVIPTARLNADGLKILGFYPGANAAGKDPSFNYQTQVSDKYPRKENIYRLDYNITDKWRTYARYISNADEIAKAYGQWNASYNIPFGPMSFGAPGWSFVENVTTIINPTLTNEFIFGSSRNDLHIIPIDNSFDRSKLGLSYKMPFPNADPLGLIQNWNYGGVPNAPTSAFNGTPFSNFNHTYDITDSMAKVRGAHTFKGGLYLHKSNKDQTAFTSVNGTIQFGRDANNPGDTQWAFSNALLGNYDTLQQSSIVLNGQYRSWNVEWYLQDNWRITPKLTLEYGIRFYWVQPQYDAADQTSSWNAALYNPASAGILQTAALVNGARVAINPLTGAQGPAALIGSLVNNGKGFVNGLYANGMGLSGGGSYPEGLIDDRGIQYAPRLGIAYQFMPKTVVRLGAGVFYDRLQGNPIFDMLPNPPSTAIPQFYYGNLATIPSAASGAFFPQNVAGFDKLGQIPTTYNWNLTIQRELPAGFLLDVAYVGASSEHLAQRYNQNTIPLGAAWLPQNQDPLNASPKFDGTTSNQPNFYRPFKGYNATNVYDFAGSSNYHALQISANRRLGKSLTGGFAYTWSKAMGTSENDNGTYQNPFNSRVADYGVLNIDRTQVLTFNYVYNTPKIIKSSGPVSSFGKLVLNDWQISGITTMASGAPSNISFSISGIGNLNERYTGSPDIGPRVVYTGPVSYPKDQYQWMTASVLALPAVKGSQGFDSARFPIRQPGDHNWDLSIFKNVPLHGESMKLQLRAELFNAWNQARFSSFNQSVTFNQAGQITNLPTALGGGGGRFGFGALTGTRDPRRIQLAVKLYF